MTVFAKKLNTGAHAGPLSGLTASLESHVQSIARSSNRAALTGAALSMESISEGQSHELQTAVDGLTTAIEGVANSLKSSGLTMSQTQRDAGVVAGVLAGDVNAFLRAPAVHSIPSGKNQVVVGMEGLQDGFSNRIPAFEAYDERDNRNAVVYSIAYNMRAGRQDAFGEAFFPTVVVTPDNVGFGVSIRLVQVYNDFKRDISGALDQYEKKNILRAAVDHTILKNEMTRIVPVNRAQSVSNFVAPADVAPAAIMLDGESINTAPLAVGKKFSLLAISQTDALIANGLMDTSDSIDPAVTLKNVYVKVGVGAAADVVRFSTANLPLSNFVAAVQGNYRLMNLNFVTDSVLVNNTTRRIDGSALQTLDDVVTSDLIVRLSVNVTGNVNIETGETVVYANSLSVYTVQDASGNFLSTTTAGPAKDVADAIAAGAVIGYDLTAFRTNMNRRQRGQLLDTTYFTQMYAVPLRSPISVVRPVTTDGQNDTSDLAALITATQIRTSNAAVTTLLESAGLLETYVDARDTAGVGPDVMGVGRFLIRPTYVRKDLNMATAINSITSHERAKDIQAVLVNQIRDIAYSLYRDSNYKPAADAMAGGEAPTPTVIIGTDQVLARYLMVEGDFRTIGPDFNVKLVSTLDARMAGRIMVGFGYFDDSSDNKPNALHFGNMAWKPELTLVLPISRGGQTSKELTVQPSFLHTVNCPILGVIQVTGVPDVIANNVPLTANII